MHPLYTPTQSVSIIPSWETDTDNWSQIFVGRTQRDLLFTPKQLSTSRSPISSPHQRFPHCSHHHWTSAEPVFISNPAPFTATIKPSGRMSLMTLTPSAFFWPPQAASRLQCHLWGLWLSYWFSLRKVVLIRAPLALILAPVSKMCFEN